MLLVNEIKLPLTEAESKLKDIIDKRLHLKGTPFKYEIYRKSLDSRKEIVFNYQVLVIIDNEDKYLSHKNVTKYKKPENKVKKVNSNVRPIIIGYGPSGIFAAVRFIEAGLKPIIIERGKRIDERIKDVERFFNDGILDESSNVQYGEGGAGTFSDAKLTTRIKDDLIDYILDVLISNGADPKIKYTAHAHIGSDNIRQVIKKITNSLISKGAEFHFEEEVIDFNVVDNKLVEIKTNKNTYKSDYFLLGIGHSAYSTFKNLFEKGVNIESKDMAIGFRVEHPQSLIDNNQYHNVKSDKLEPSEYFLRYKDELGVYSFCMCPGGIVVNATSDKNRIVTNGMSYSKRDSLIANSAILVQVERKDYGDDSPLAGFNYLKAIEEKAYNLSNSYKAPCMNIKDYINNELNPLIFNSTYSLGTTLYDLNKLFTVKQNELFKKALLFFDQKIPGFIDSGIMVGVETRSSCPIRIKRNEFYESTNTKGLYPMGEGSGYGGGIMSCALDGIKVVDKILETLK